MRKNEPYIRIYRGIYYIHHRIHNKIYRVSTGTKDEAAAKRCLADYLDGLSSLPEKNEVTVNDAINIYLKEKEHKVAMGEMRDSNFAKLSNFFKQPRLLLGDLFTRQINRNVCRHYIERRVRMNPDISSSTIRTELAHLRSALSFCFKEGHIYNDFMFYLPKASAPRQRILTLAEIRKILIYRSDSHIRRFCIIALCTGQRAGAILELTFDRVDFDKGVLDFSDAFVSNKKRGIVYMNSLLRLELESARASNTSEYVIEYKGNGVKCVKNSLKTLFRNLGIEGASAHTLKHTAVSLFMNSGVSSSELSLMINTTEQTLSKHYSKAIPDFLKPKYEIMANLIKVNGK